MEFEWDPAKAAVNAQKHGIGFVDAIAVFDDPHRLEAGTTKPEHGEKRRTAIGRTAGVVSRHGGPAGMSERDTIRARRLPDRTVV